MAGDATRARDTARRARYLTRHAAGCRQRAEDLRLAELRLCDVPEGGIARDVALTLADLDTDIGIEMEECAILYLRDRALKVVRDGDEQVVVRGGGSAPRCGTSSTRSRTSSGIVRLTR
ncbi:hypothetical protein E2562_020964 [Oryza meyeriana var. granulata]|uniref:Uncharacterized protein n=1 Tax=Oryza meyeriana var. granulata TaxID=110450 RepID=A0A6G1E0Y4_9ORYZ|nr:hypothetical protein E2562_020964 [Oryza meyeriana var. granulata]